MQADREADRVLLIPFAPGIGDVVMTEPLIRAVQKGLPGWRLWVAAREVATDVLRPEGYEFVFPSVFVDRAPRPLRPIHRYVPQRVVAWLAEPAIKLDLGPFDKVINLFLAWERLLPFQEWWTPQWPLQPGTMHTVDLMVEYLEQELQVQVPREEREPRIAVFAEAQEWADDYLRANVSSGQPVIPLVVTAANALKWWSPAKWGELNGRLNDLGWRTLLIAPRDDPHASQVYHSCSAQPLWPDASLRQVSALLARADAVVGIDTGPLHLAAALGTPWVGLYGPTNPDIIGPYTSTPGRAIPSRFPKPDSCASCWLAFKNREDECLTLPITGCTTLIPVEQVLSAVEAVGRGDGRRAA
jgi:ADP-heptose:LPS heptosyltransferase